MTVSPSESSRPSRLPLALLAAAVFFLHLLVTPGHLLSPDEELMYRMAEGIATEGSTAVLPLEADVTTGMLPPGLPPSATFATRLGKEPGEFYAQYLPLQPLLAVPFLGVAGVFESTFAERFAAAVPAGMTTLYLDGLDPVTRARALFRRGLLAMLFNPFVSALTALALARLGMLLTGSRRAGIIAAASWAFGTVAWPHARSFFTEPLAGLLILVGFDSVVRWHLSSNDGRLKHAVLAGVFLALGNWTRVDSPFFTAGLVLAMGVLAVTRYLSDDARGIVTRSTRIGDVVLTGGIATLAWIGLQIFNHARFGADLTAGYGDQSEGVKFTTPILEGLHGLLLSPGKGMFFFSPALLLGVWGWMRVPFHLRWLRNLALATWLPFFIAMAMWQNWDGGWCWGPRHVVQVHAPIMLGAIFLFTGAMNWKRKLAAGIIFPVSIAVQVYGSSQSPLEFYHEFFRTVNDGDYFRVAYRPQEVMTAEQSFVLRFANAEGSGNPPVSALPAPMVDSLYIPAHTQWHGYAEMWSRGYRDWFFWNLVVGNKQPNRWVRP